MIQTNGRQDAELFPLAIGQREVVERVEREGHMVHACGVLRLGGGAGDADDGDAVVLLVVAEEGEHLVFIAGGRAEEVFVIVDHRLEVCGAQDDVREHGWALDFGGWGGHGGCCGLKVLVRTEKVGMAMLTSVECLYMHVYLYL